MNGGNGGFTVAELNDLPPSLGLEAAAMVLGIGRTNAYAMVQRGDFPVPVLRIGRRYRVSTQAILKLLGVEPPTSPRHASPDR